MHACAPWQGPNSVKKILKSCWVQAIAMRFTDKEFESVGHQRKHCRSKQNSIKYAQ
jgi:hypothetical protein